MAAEKLLAYYYDLQSCPFLTDANDCIQRLRDKFENLGSEVEFVVTCDVLAEKPEALGPNVKFIGLCFPYPIFSSYYCRYKLITYLKIQN